MNYLSNVSLDKAGVDPAGIPSVSQIFLFKENNSGSLFSGQNQFSTDNSLAGTADDDDFIPKYWC